VADLVAHQPHESHVSLASFLLLLQGCCAHCRRVREECPQAVADLVALLIQSPAAALPLSSPSNRLHHCRRVPEECPQAVADLVAQCMDAEPTVRPSAKEVVSLLMQPDMVLDRPLPGRRKSGERTKLVRPPV